MVRVELSRVRDGREADPTKLRSILAQPMWSLCGRESRERARVRPGNRTRQNPRIGPRPVVGVQWPDRGEERRQLGTTFELGRVVSKSRKETIESYIRGRASAVDFTDRAPIRKPIVDSGSFAGLARPYFSRSSSPPRASSEKSWSCRYPTERSPSRPFLGDEGYLCRTEEVDSCGW
eukprot:g5976.t1